jgi:dTDP-4-dehydrorhamnose reductase
MRRTLLIGASGQLGHALSAAFSSDMLVTASAHHAREWDEQIDLADVSALRSALARVRPDLILVAGAMCNVDECERQPLLCEQINVTGPAAVAEYAGIHGARIVFFSTDSVFDGARPPYVETDAINPLNVYSHSKACAEARIRVAAPHHHLIIRTAWLYGPDAQRRNFVWRLVDRVAAGESVRVPSDQWGSPTYTDDVAHATRILVELDAGGTFHATGLDFIDRGAFALQACAHFGVDPGAVVLRPTSELGQVAPRPLRVQLDCEKLRRAGVPAFRRLADGLRSLADTARCG